MRGGPRTSVRKPGVSELIAADASRPPAQDQRPLADTAARNSSMKVASIGPSWVRAKCGVVGSKLIMPNSCAGAHFTKQ